MLVGSQFKGYVQTQNVNGIYVDIVVYVRMMEPQPMLTFMYNNDPESAYKQLFTKASGHFKTESKQRAGYIAAMQTCGVNDFYKDFDFVIKSASITEQVIEIETGFRLSSSAKSMDSALFNILMYHYINTI